MGEIRDRALWWELPDISLTPGLLDHLEAALDQVSTDLSLRALVITGPQEEFDSIFSVGMNIDFLGECFADPPGVFIPFVTRYHALLHRIEELPVPIVAAVNGLARAGGFELLLACDFVFIATEAKIGDHHLASGLPPGAGAAIRAQRTMGTQRAKEVLFTASWLTSEEAVASGIALRAVPRAQLHHEISEFIKKLLPTSRSAIAATKLALIQAEPTRDGCAAELALFADFVTNDPLASEGYRSWIEKRKPSWP
jgi:enoyl-CoA hydratase/carnithine racemase